MMVCLLGGGEVFGVGDEEDRVKDGVVEDVLCKKGRR
jgi:hypothetical protein